VSHMQQYSAVHFVALQFMRAFNNIDRTTCCMHGAKDMTCGGRACPVTPDNTCTCPSIQAAARGRPRAPRSGAEGRGPGAQRALQERRAFCADVAAHLREAWRPASQAAAKRRMQRCNAVRAWHGAAPQPTRHSSCDV